MTLSIRTRLHLWMIGGMAALLAVFAITMYGSVRLALLKGFDEVLTSTARTISASIEQNERQLRVEIDEKEFPEFRRSKHPDYFQIWNWEGAVLARSPSLRGVDLVQLEDKSESPVFRPVRLPDGRKGRAIGMVFAPKVDDDVKVAFMPRKLTLVVARGTAALDSEIEFFEWLLASASAGMIGLALLVGTIVVRRAAKPLDDLAATIAALPHDDLSARVSTKGMPAEIVPVVQRLNDLLRRLDDAFRRERTFSADVAHELRTPLSGIRSTIEVALAHPRGGVEYREAMNDCLEIVRCTQSMVDSLMTLARLEGEQRALPPETLRFAPLIEAVWEPFEAQMLRRGITVTKIIPPDLSCAADRESLRLILTNLLANAAEYTDDAGRIQIMGLRSGELARLTVVNSGCHLSEEDARHVFDRFWRGDASRTDTGVHYGLGLALVKRAVCSLGGDITASTADGSFSISLTLPAAPRAE